MGYTTALRREIKERFTPAMAERGFACDMRKAPQFFTFRRITPDAVQVFDIQWEKYGRPRFVVNFGQCAAAGVVIGGELVAPQDVFPNSTPIWGRLSPGRGGTTGNWFRQDRPLLERIGTWSSTRSPAEVMTTLMTLFPELEEFWKNGQTGRHSRVWTSSRGGIANANQARS
jgi:hypothetical protein